MKADKLISILLDLPSDTEIVIHSGDDILGDYEYRTDISVSETTGMLDETGTIWTTYSNYGRTNTKPMKVWCIE